MRRPSPDGTAALRAALALTLSLALSLGGAAACSPRTDHATSRASNVAASDSAMDAAAVAPLLANADVTDASTTSAADLDAAASPWRDVHYDRVLHIGDSTVGGNGGLAKALKARFAAEGTKYVADTTVSLAITTFAHTPAFKKELLARDPDLVLITLGTNDVFIPNPASLASAVQAIVARSQVGRPGGARVRLDRTADMEAGHRDRRGDSAERGAMSFLRFEPHGRRRARRRRHSPDRQGRGRVGVAGLDISPPGSGGIAVDGA